MHPFAVPREEPAEEAALARVLHELEPVVADLHQQETERAVVARMHGVLDPRVEVPLEEADRRIERTKREREVVGLPDRAVLLDAPAPRRRDRTALHLRRLPELDQRAEAE